MPTPAVSAHRGPSGRVQHASANVLKAMKRPAKQDRVLQRIQQWRRDVPDLAIRSTFIVGFPGETEAAIREHLASGRVDLILLDVMLGDENGVEICARLRAEQDVPIILVSALSADHQRMAG